MLLIYYKWQYGLTFFHAATKQRVDVISCIQTEDIGFYPAPRPKSHQNRVSNNYIKIDEGADNLHRIRAYFRSIRITSPWLHSTLEFPGKRRDNVISRELSPVELTVSYTASPWVGAKWREKLEGEGKRLDD